jgi:hypothetical protein
MPGQQRRQRSGFGSELRFAWLEQFLFMNHAGLYCPLGLLWFFCDDRIGSLSGR